MDGIPYMSASLKFLISFYWLGLQAVIVAGFGLWCYILGLNIINYMKRMMFTLLAIYSQILHNQDKDEDKCKRNLLFLRYTNNTFF